MVNCIAAVVTLDACALAPVVGVCITAVTTDDAVESPLIATLQTKESTMLAVAVETTVGVSICAVATEDACALAPFVACI